MEYYYEHNAPTEARTLIRIERNTKNPLPGRTFVSIAYYRNASGAVYGIVF